MLSKKKRNLMFVEAGVITLCFYFLAIVINLGLDAERLDYFNYELEKTDLDSETFKASVYFFNNLESDYCENEKEFMFNYSDQIREIAVDLNNLGALFHISNKNKSELNKRELYLKELELYEALVGHNERCDENIVPVFYFFDGLSTDLDKQSLILEQYYLNNQNKTMIFSFDINYDKDPHLNSLVESYNIENAPFVVIGNKTSRDLATNNEGVISLNTLSVEFLRQRGELE